MAYIQERPGKDGKPNFRVQVRLRGYPVQTATEIRKAILTIKNCLDEERKLPDICMEVVDDLLLKENNDR